jgi:hypothetical protein
LQYLEVSHGGEEYREENAVRALKRNEKSIKVSIEKLDAVRKSSGSHLWDSVAYLYYANLNEAMLTPVAGLYEPEPEVYPVVAGAVFC